MGLSQCTPTCGVARDMPRSSVLLPAFGKPTRPTSANSFISSSSNTSSPAWHATDLDGGKLLA